MFQINEMVDVKIPFELDITKDCKIVHLNNKRKMAMVSLPRSDKIIEVDFEDIVKHNHEEFEHNDLVKHSFMKGVHRVVKYSEQKGSTMTIISLGKKYTMLVGKKNLTPIRNKNGDVATYKNLKLRVKGKR